MLSVGGEALHAPRSSYGICEAAAPAAGANRSVVVPHFGAPFLLLRGQNGGWGKNVSLISPTYPPSVSLSFFCLFDCLRYLSIEHLFPSIPMPSSVTAVARERSPTPAAALSAETAPAASKEEAMTKKASSSIDENVDKTNVKKQPAPEDPAGVDARVRALYYVMQSVEVSV